MTDTPTTEAAPESPRPAPGPRRLPVGPVGLLLITAVALGAAFLVARLIVDNADSSDAIDVQEMLDASTKAGPLVNPEAKAEIGSLAPNARLEYLDGGTQQLSELAGQGTPVLLNFWASTCAPCIKEMPAMEQVHTDMGGAVTFVGIDVSDTVEDGQKMVARTGVTYRNARDPKADIAAVFGALSLPRTVLIGGDGTVLAVHNGEMNADDVTAMLNEHGITAA